jgi:hypothetical protein
MKIDTEYTREPVCPYCGYVFRNAWELNFDEGLEGQTETDCGECERPLKIWRNVSISYSTKKESEANNG